MQLHEWWALFKGTVGYWFSLYSVPFSIVCHSHVCVSFNCGSVAEIMSWFFFNCATGFTTPGVLFMTTGALIMWVTNYVKRDIVQWELAAYCTFKQRLSSMYEPQRIYTWSCFSHVRKISRQQRAVSGEFSSLSTLVEWGCWFHAIRSIVCVWPSGRSGTFACGQGDF